MKSKKEQSVDSWFDAFLCSNEFDNFQYTMKSVIGDNVKRLVLDAYRQGYDDGWNAYEEDHEKMTDAEVNEVVSQLQSVLRTTRNEVELALDAIELELEQNER